MARPNLSRKYVSKCSVEDSLFSRRGRPKNFGALV